MSCQTMSCLRLLVGIAIASAWGTPSVNAAPARRLEITPLSKVTTMLEELRLKINSEAEAEAKTYNTFACFCKDTMAEKSAAITAGEDEKNTLQARLNEASAARDGEDQSISEKAADAQKASQDLEQLRAARRTEFLEYERSEVDLTAAVQALTAAIHALQAARTATASSLAELRAAGKLEPVEKALLLAETLGHAAVQKRASTALFAIRQTPSVPTSVYDFHAGDVISTLEDLKTSFKAKKDELNQQEATNKHSFDTQVQDLQESMKGDEAALENHRKNKVAHVSLIVTTSQDLTATSAQLLDDQAYLAGLSATCKTKAQLWDQRTQLRADELQALTQALQAMRDLAARPRASPSLLARERGDDVGDDAPPALLQLATARRVQPHLPRELAQHPQNAALGGGERGPSSSLLGRRARAVQLLRTKATSLKSGLLSHLASQMSADPLAKVKQLIQDLIERLLKEAQDEGNHKGWCDHEAALAEQKRDTAAAEVKELTSRVDVRAARITKLEAKNQTLSTEIVELSARMNQSAATRAAEKSENLQAVKDAQDAQAIVTEAARVLSQFYGAAANADISLLALRAENVTVPTSGEPQAPDAGFDDVYMGSQDAGGGVLAMLEVLASDFARTIAETTQAEAIAEQDFAALQRTTGASLASKDQEKKERLAALAAANIEDSEDRAALTAHETTVNQARAELEALAPACFDSGTTFEERKMRREDEMDALRQALCILDGHATGGSENC